jgi:hypothetical protein
VLNIITLPKTSILTARYPKCVNNDLKLLTLKDSKLLVKPTLISAKLYEALTKVIGMKG